MKQNPFLRPLQPDRDVDDVDAELDLPNLKQDPLLGQLKPEDEAAFEQLNLPPEKQDPLLRQLRPLDGQADDDEAFDLPEVDDDDDVDDPLGGQLVPNHTGQDLVQDPPSHKQNPLLKQLKPGSSGHFEGVEAPNAKQNPLLRPLSAGKSGSSDKLQLPPAKQDPLLRPLKSHQNEAVFNQNPPSSKQNPLLHQLKAKHEGQVEGLRTPSSKQNPLLRPLTSGHTSEKDGLEVPSVKQDPLLGSLKNSDRFNPEGLDLPKKRQNPLLRLLRLDRMKTSEIEGLNPPSLSDNPLILQVMKTPQKFRSEFAELPPKMQQKLVEILKRNGGEHFNADLLLEPPTPTRDDFVGSDFTRQNFDEEFESTSRRVPEFAPIFRQSTEDPTTGRIRPLMPKSKFEILQSSRPVEEVTLQRVNLPLERPESNEAIEDEEEEGNEDFFTLLARSGASGILVFASGNVSVFGKQFLRSFGVKLLS